MPSSAPSSRVRAVIRSRALLERIQNVCDAVHQGVWLGLLDADGWQEFTDHHYTTRNRTTKDANYFAEAFNLRGFFLWEQSAFDAHMAGCKSILVASAGGGREVLAVSRRGVKVDAFECNPQLVEACRAFLASQGVAATVLAAAPNEVPEWSGMYDGAILGWGAYIHMVGRERRIRFLKGLHRHLTPGAPLLISFFLYRHSKARRLTYTLASALRMIRRAGPVERGDSLTTTFDHRFTEEEIRQELGAAGFDVVFYSERRFGHAVAKAV